jgi:fructose-1,6-bisphosphatase/inositol monophosphatase family enzyme
MRDIVSRVASFVRKSRHTFEAEHKGIKPDGRIDWVTNIDKEAQRMAIRLLQENMPSIGIVAEEQNGIAIPSKEPTKSLWFSLDPIDGTRAFVHRFSFGISVMLALMDEDKVIAVCICDIMTEEMYYYRPDSENTHHFDAKSGQRLLNELPRDIPLSQQYLLIRDPVEVYNDMTRRLLQIKPHPLFRRYESTSGSIGLSMTRLWKGEVGGAILRAGDQNPWDVCPIIGLMERLGFVYFKIIPNQEEHNLCLSQIHLIASRSIFTIDCDMLVIHKSNILELTRWCIEEGICIICDPIL